MNPAFGIVFAIVAMLSWGIGDFFIQRSTRKIGDIETLFVITIFGVVVLLPFVWRDLPALLKDPASFLPILLFASVVMCIAALMEFEALRRGKLAVVEPIWSLEIPASALIAFLILGERLNTDQVIFIVTLIMGLMFVSFKSTELKAKHFLEKGVLISVFAAIMMGASNFFMGFSGRLTDTFMINFVSCVVMASVTGSYLVYYKKGRGLIQDIKNNPKMLFTMALFDNIAWIAFVAAMTLSQIGVVVALTESYIIIVVLLGIFINHEKLHLHQKAGLVLAVCSAVLLALQSA